MTTSTRSIQNLSQSTLSVWIVSGMTVLALLLGLVIKSVAENQTRPLQHAGVTAQTPAGWIVQNGLESEQTVFTTHDPFNSSQIYSVDLIPTSAEMTISDLAFTFNLQRGQKTTLFRTLDQSTVKINGKDVLRIHYSFVDPKNQETLPVVMEGVEYIFLSQPKALIVSMEDETSNFKGALPSFMKFLGTVAYAPGGNQ
jgi:hypothetical protein